MAALGLLVQSAALPPPEAELHVALTEGLLPGEEETLYLVCNVFAACCLESYVHVEPNETLRVTLPTAL